MEKYLSHTGSVLPLRRSNVDTDQIIPAVYLKRVTKSGFEDGLFGAWRNDPEFVLNKAEFAGAKRGDTAVKHQAEVGTGYFDLVATAINPESGTLALTGSTEEEQFH